MDTVKIGNFIRECRKNKNLTQKQLGDKLFVEAKTVSKWETGKGIPEVQTMYNLCKVLDITLNELYVGEHLDNKDADSSLEKVILESFENERRRNTSNVVGQIIVGIALILSSTLMVLVAGLVEMETIARVILIITASLSMIIGIAGLVVLDANVGYFECDECHERFAPSVKEYVFSLHSLTKRKLKCPKCGKTSWCSKRMSKKDE